jgi:DNA polymerase-3 subunit gamma/tau
MDAASRTGIDDIRELIESVRYRPVSARTKVYIIDEVHMLSRQAFNGLLKTLEEPPEHVVFVFATTEIRKVPVTVLSRCQRFDLRRVEEARLAAHFADIAAREGAEATPGALAMIARAADGSVRDGLSLLDQAIALSGGAVGEDHVKDMLGLADRAQVFDLFEAVMGGKVAEALDLMAGLYAAGADPAVVLQDLLELTHTLTRVRLVPEVAQDAAVPETERVRGRALAEKLGVPALGRAWQILLKGLGEARTAPSPRQAAEMVLIRLAHASDLPSPAELVRKLSETGPGPAGGGGMRSSAAPESGAAPVSLDPPPPSGGPLAVAAPEPAPLAAPIPEAPPPDAPTSDAPTAEDIAPMPRDYAEVVALARARKEGILANHLAQNVHLVRFEPGVVEFRPGERAPRSLAGQLGQLLQAWTGERWVVGVSDEAGEASLAQQYEAERTRRFEAAAEDPLVQEALTRFPGARITEVRMPGEAPAAADDGAEPGGPEATEIDPIEEREDLL